MPLVGYVHLIKCTLRALLVCLCVLTGSLGWGGGEGGVGGGGMGFVFRGARLLGMPRHISQG